MFESERPTRRETGFVATWWLWLLALAMFAGCTGVVGNWMFGWFRTPFEVTSPENVQEQWRFAYDYLESLEAVATQVCTAERAVAGAVSDDERVQRQTQLIALENNYARLAAEYDGRLRDAFRAKIVAPADVPERAPSLEANKTKVCS